MRYHLLDDELPDGAAEGLQGQEFVASVGSNSMRLTIRKFSDGAMVGDLLSFVP